VRCAGISEWRTKSRGNADVKTLPSSAPRWAAYRSFCRFCASVLRHLGGLTVLQQSVQARRQAVEGLLPHFSSRHARTAQKGGRMDTVNFAQVGKNCLKH